jgi:hypothetical protein
MIVGVPFKHGKILLPSVPGKFVFILIRTTLVAEAARQFVGVPFLLFGFSETYQFDPGSPDCAATRYM